MRVFYLFFLSLSISFSSMALPFELHKIASLNKIEPYAPQVFHAGLLWLGRLDYQTGRDRSYLEIRSEKGKNLLHSQYTSNSIINIFPFDEKRVLFTGKRYTEKGWRTFYSLAQYSKGRLTLESHMLPAPFQIEEFTGGPAQLFFGLVSDQTLIQLTHTGYNQMQLKISAPGRMFKID